eukprot:4738297-Ditylum_brightwellii.AAC.1
MTHKAKRYDTKTAPHLYSYAKAGKHKILPKPTAAEMLVQRKAVREYFLWLLLLEIPHYVC